MLESSLLGWVIAAVAFSSVALMLLTIEIFTLNFLMDTSICKIIPIYEKNGHVLLCCTEQPNQWCDRQQ